MRDNTILLMGAPRSAPANLDFLKAYESSGKNFGNLLIGNGAVSVLEGYTFVTRSSFRGPEEADEKCHHVLIPAANFLWKGFDFGYMADFLERTCLPITIVGLGAQTSDRSVVSTVHPNTLRLVKLIAERSPSIGVRGFYTAEVLAANGILNVEVLGCPSLYTLGTPPMDICSLTEDLLSRIAVNFSRRVNAHSFAPAELRAVENALLKFAVEEYVPFIAQDELEELRLSHGEDTESDRQCIADYFTESQAQNVLDYFRSQTRYFANVNEWFEFISGRSGSVGSRLHGNLISLISGRPSLTFAHDSRTLELCALIGAPYINIKEIEPDAISPQFIIERLLAADYSRFISNISTLFSKYRAFLDRHGLKNNLKLLSPVKRA